MDNTRPNVNLNVNLRQNRIKRHSNNSSINPKNIISAQKLDKTREGNTPLNLPINNERKINTSKLNKKEKDIPNSYEFYKGKIDENIKQSENIKRKIEECSKQSESIKGKIEECNKQLENINEEINKYNKHLKLVNEEIYKYNKQLKLVNAEIYKYKEKIQIIENSKNKDKNKIFPYKKVIPKNINNINIENRELQLIKPKGIINIKGSCYLNSCLQCLIHIRSLTFYFCNNSFFESNILCKEYKSIISRYIYNNINTINPYNFKRELIKINHDYNMFGNDPKDFIRDFIFNINKELLGEDQSFVLKNDIKKTNKIELFRYYRDEFQRSQTIITELFGWIKQIEKTCSSCKQKTYEFIVDTNFIFNLQKICKVLKKNNLMLKECFNDYFSDENKKFKCKSCGIVDKRGKISNKICMLPNYLIIILDRGKDDLFNCNIDFDYEIDIKEVTEQIEDKSNTKYKLLGATFLYGTSGAGHTIAFCKHFDDVYYIFDDENYYPGDLKNLKKDKPFIIFYEKEL